MAGGSAVIDNGLSSAMVGSDETCTTDWKTRTTTNKVLRTALGTITCGDHCACSGTPMLQRYVSKGSNKASSNLSRLEISCVRLGAVWPTE